MVQWNRSTERLIGQRERWRQDFTREYARKEALWQKRYDTLIDNKNAWMTKASRDAVSTGARSMAVDMGFDADQLIGEVSFSLIPDMTTQAGSASDIVSEALCGTTVYRLLDSVRNITSRTGGHDVILSASLPTVPDTTREVANLTEKQNELKEDLQKALAMAQAKQMVRMLNETRETIDESIDDANYDVDSSVDSTLSAAGYARRGDSYDRTVIIDSTLWGNPETERQKVGAYEDFKAPAFDHGIDLSEGMLEDLNSTIIQARVQLAQKNMMNYLNLIFGLEEAERDGLDKNFLALLDRQAQAFKNSAQYGDKYTDDEGEVQYKHTDVTGLFNYHVGYAPVMEKKKPEKVKTDGYGQRGRIYKDYMIQQARLYRGLSTVDAPWYNQKLWDDDADNDGKSDGIVGAPSVRAVNGIAASIVGTYFGGPLGGMLASMVNDAIFTMADVSTGYMDAGEAGLGFAKRSAVQAVTYKVGSAMGGWTDSISGSVSGITEVAADIGMKAVEITANNYTSAAINAIGTDGFSWSSFNRSTSWNSMSTSYASGLAGEAVNSTLSEVNLVDSNNLQLSKNVFNTKDIANLNDLVSGLTSSSIEYAMTDRTKLNVLNFGMLGLNQKNGDPLESGLLELNIGGGESIFNIGTSGTDVSIGRINSAISGYQESKKVASYKYSGDDREFLFNGLNMMGYSDIERNYKNARSIFDENISVETISGLRNTNDDLARGFVSADDRDKIYLNSDTLGMGKESAAQLASLLSHESTHAEGDRTEFNAYLNEATTYKNLTEKFGLGDDSYQSYLIKQLLNDENASENAGKEDNAEWYINDEYVGIRSSSPFINPIGSIKNTFIRLFGGNPDKQNKVPEGEYDYERNQLAKERANKDAFNTVVTLATTARSAQLSGGNMTFNEFLANFYSPVPDLKTMRNMSANDAVGLAGNISGYIDSSFKNGNFNLDCLSNFSDFKSGIRGLDSFHDVEGYNEFKDQKIIEYLKEAGIPIKMYNDFGNNEIAQAKAINQLMDNFNFGSTLYQSGMTAESAGILYHLGALTTYSGESGKTWTINEPGMSYSSNINSNYIKYVDSLKYLEQYNSKNKYPIYSQDKLSPLYNWESINEYFSYY